MSSLLMLVGLVVIIVALVRIFTKPIRRGQGGAVAELLAEMIVLPFKIAGALLRALGRMWADSRRRRVRLGNDHPWADRAAQGAQRASANRAARTVRNAPLTDSRGYSVWDWLTGRDKEHDNRIGPDVRDERDQRPADPDPGFEEWWRDTYGDDSPN